MSSIICFFTGATIGFIIGGLLAAAKDDDE